MFKKLMLGKYSTWHQFFYVDINNKTKEGATPNLIMYIDN